MGTRSPASPSPRMGSASPLGPMTGRRGCGTWRQGRRSPGSRAMGSWLLASPSPRTGRASPLGPGTGRRGSGIWPRGRRSLGLRAMETRSRASPSPPMGRASPPGRAREGSRSPATPPPVLPAPSGPRPGLRRRNDPVSPGSAVRRGDRLQPVAGVAQSGQGGAGRMWLPAEGGAQRRDVSSHVRREKSDQRVLFLAPRDDAEHTVRQWTLQRLRLRPRAVSQVSHSGTSVRITGIALGWTASTSAFGVEVRKPGDPVLMVLDEPNSNLDAAGQDALNVAIRQAKAEGKAVVIMAHRPGGIAECDMASRPAAAAPRARPPKRSLRGRAYRRSVFHTASARSRRRRQVDKLDRFQP